MKKPKQTSLEAVSGKSAQRRRRKLNFTSEDWYEQAFKTCSISSQKAEKEEVISPPLVPNLLKG